MRSHEELDRVVRDMELRLAKLERCSVCEGEGTVVLWDPDAEGGVSAPQGCLTCEGTGKVYP